MSKADGGEDGGTRGVENAFESVDAEGAGNGNFFLAGDEQGTDGLSDSPKTNMAVKPARFMP